jgi:hypothetical protein
VAAIPLFLIWFIPYIISGIHNNFSSVNSLTAYISTYSHGFHLVRFLQLFKDAFIEIEEIVHIDFIKYYSFLLLPLFIFLYLRGKMMKDRLVLCYLFSLWFIIPWIVFTFYSGEISDYYFTFNRPIATIILAYIIYRLLIINNYFIKAAVGIFCIYYAYINLISFYNDKYDILPKVRVDVDQTVKVSGVIEYGAGDPKSYLYYIQTLKNR